jgi:hypothetical protein
MPSLAGRRLPFLGDTPRAIIMPRMPHSPRTVASLDNRPMALLSEAAFLANNVDTQHETVCSAVSM